MNSIFKRYELKYMLSTSQYFKLLSVMQSYMTQDKYGKHKITNVYYDTDDYLLIRRSIEKPCYKEKLRVRRYAQNQEVFVELKKKYKGIVYKRRVTLPMQTLFDTLVPNNALQNTSQINHEINYFLDFYDTIAPRVFLSYDRSAYFGNIDKDFRMTFDENIIARHDDVLNFDENHGDKVLDDGIFLLEVKTATGIPMWLADFFSENKIYKTSFSKYGTAYKNMIKAGAYHVV